MGKVTNGGLRRLMQRLQTAGLLVTSQHCYVTVGMHRASSRRMAGNRAHARSQPGAMRVVACVWIPPKPAALLWHDGHKESCPANWQSVTLVE